MILTMFLSSNWSQISLEPVGVVDEYIENIMQLLCSSRMLSYKKPAFGTSCDICGPVLIAPFSAYSSVFTNYSRNADKQRNEITKAPKLFYISLSLSGFLSHRNFRYVHYIQSIVKIIAQFEGVIRINAFLALGRISKK